MGLKPPKSRGRQLRSQLWFDNPDNPGMTALYLERYLNYGLTKQELTSGKPIIGIAQTGSDLSPCNRHHLELAERVRDGIRSAGGIAFEFPVHPLQETGKRPTAALDRNLAYLGLVEVLYGYPLDGVVLTTGCDKTTPACLMAAATVNIPAIVLSGGPMLNGWWKGERAGSGTVVWQARADHAAGKIGYDEFIDIVTSSAPSVGHCNTMGTASTMNALAEALGMSLPGCAAIPAPYRERAQIAYETGVRAVEIVHEDLKPTDILTRKAFENTIVACSAIGGSTNAPIHINAIARHVGVKLSIEDWEKIGYDVPLLVDMQPAGKYLGEDYYRAGGLPAVMQRIAQGRPSPRRRDDHQRQDHGRERSRRKVQNRRRDPRLRQADEEAGWLQGAQGQPIRFRHHEDERDLGGIPPALSLESEKVRMHSKAARSCSRARKTITAALKTRRLKIDENTLLVIRGVGAIGYPGSAEVVNMQPPAALIKEGHHRAAVHRRRPAIRNLRLALDPECVAGGGGRRRAGAAANRRPHSHRSCQGARPIFCVSKAELARRRAALEKHGGFAYPASQTPWQEIQRAMVDQLADGMVLKPAVKYQRIAQKSVPRDNH